MVPELLTQNYVQQVLHKHLEEFYKTSDPLLDKRHQSPPLSVEPNLFSKVQGPFNTFNRRCPFRIFARVIHGETIAIATPCFIKHENGKALCGLWLHKRPLPRMSGISAKLSLANLFHTSTQNRLIIHSCWISTHKGY